MVTVIGALALIVIAACTGTANSTARAPAPPPFTIKAMMLPNLGQILADAQGMPLYFFMPEKDAKVVCTGACSATWKPLLLNGSPVPTSQAQLPGKLSMVARPEGAMQVTYNEWPLYTYVSDKKVGVPTGQAAGGEWFVMKAVWEQDFDGDSDGTMAPPPTPVPAPPPTDAPAAPPAMAPAPPPMRPPPPPVFLNDHDADNMNGPSDGDGNK
jgi:predicted lipoprotein with Yx(FWY)xxD motif